jgi:DNA-binding XRE family transcriptional regulator
MITKKYKGFKDALTVIEKYTGKPTFGMFLRVARSTMDVTQAEMARILGVPRSMVCDIEKNRQNVSLNLAVKIAKKAGLSTHLAVQLCLNDQIKRAKIKYKVEVKTA